jgi:hypothetical protein
MIDTGLVVENGERLEASRPPEFGKAEVDSNVSILEGVPAGFVPKHAPEIPRDLAPNEVQRLVDLAKLERANAAHESIRVRVANNAGSAGYTTRASGYIDVCCVRRDRVVLHEVKSATETNFLSQIRHAVSQLYEYRYVQDLAHAELCIAIEIAPPDRLNWVVDYLYDDREISLIHLDGRNHLVEAAGRHCVDEFAD